jgi:hypothetical protein
MIGWLRAFGCGWCHCISVAFQVIEEGADQGWGQILDGHAIDGLPSMLAGKRQQECQDIAVADLRVPGEIAFRHQMFEEEPPNPWPQERLILHDRPPSHRSSPVLAG